MKMTKLLASAGALAFATSSIPVAAQVVNFDGITTSATVDNYYNGGTSSAGDVGPDYGIVFQTGDWVAQTAFGQTSAPNLAYSSSGSGWVNFLDGITTGLNFSYGAFTDSTLSVYDGFNGTGTLLGTFALPQNDPYNFDWVALPFGGTAHSVIVSSGAAQFGWDDISFGTLTPENPVPEPASWAMMLAGMGALGFAMRRRNATRAAVSFS